MTPRKLNIFFAFFTYSGNSGAGSEHPSIRDWFAKTMLLAKADQRIGEIESANFNDTPVVMVRNAAVRRARAAGSDLIVMCDSDQVPDVHLGQDDFTKPFFKTAFDFIYENWDRGPNVVGCPYCGPPAAGENCFVFRWSSFGTNEPDQQFSIEQFGREEAAQLTGITPVAALPTGLIMFDMRAFELIDPTGRDQVQVLRDFKAGTISEREALRELRIESWFYYEYTDHFCTEKASTEDVTCTRDISFHGILKNGRNPIHCAWDCWAGHAKSKIVGKPRIVYVDEIGTKYQKAVLLDRRRNERLQAVPMQLGISTPQRDLDALSRLIENCRQMGPLTIVEVGSWIGASSRAIAKAMGADSVLWCVDTWQGTRGDQYDLTGAVALAYGSDRLFKTWERNVSDVGYPDRIFAVRGESVGVAGCWQREADVIFLDADHRYESVKADIEAWWPHLKPGGIFAGHDYGVTQLPGVTKAVDERFGTNGDVKCFGTIWWIRKPDPGIAKSILDSPTFTLAERMQAAAGHPARAGESVLAVQRPEGTG